MQDGAGPVAAVFSGLEGMFAIALGLVAYRIGFGKVEIGYSPSSFLITVCALLSLTAACYAFSQEEYAAGSIFAAQTLGDFASWMLSRRASSNGFIRGSGSIWRIVVSCTMTVLSAVFVAESDQTRSLFFAIFALRLLYAVSPTVELRVSKVKSTESLDEWGLLFNRWPANYARVFVTFPGDEEEDDAESALFANRIEGLSESVFTGASQGATAPSSRNNSESTTDSSDSFSLLRPGTGALSRSFAPHVDPTTQADSRPADDAAGPRPEENIVLRQRLPHSVRVITHRDVLTTGGVPLVVFVMQVDSNGIVVHRYGEFRALGNRVVSKMYHDLGAEPPPFPGRRVFRKFIPQAMGGFAQGEAADREFIENRATGLGDWMQNVLNFVREHPHSDNTVLSLLDFLKPIVHFSPQSDMDQVVRSAVLIFADTVLNPIAPPSPNL